MPIVVVGNAKSTLGTNAFPSKNQTTLGNLDMGKIPETNTGWPRTEIRKRENWSWNKYFVYIDVGVLI